MSLNKKRLILSENDKSYIKKLYGILKEQDPKEREYDYSKMRKPIDFEVKSEDEFTEKITFLAGFHSQQYMKTDNLVSQLDKIINTITKSPDFRYKLGTGTKYELIITTQAGESQIPNNDYENNSVELAPGELAKKRELTINEFIQEYINNNLPKLSEPSGQPIVKYKSIKNKVKIGDTPWNTTFPIYYAELKKCGIIKGKNPSRTTPGPNCNKKYLDLHNQYESEQFVMVNVKLVKVDVMGTVELPTIKPSLIPQQDITGPNIQRCIRGFTIDVNYPRKGDHTCNSAIYEVYVNGIQINRNDGAPYMSLNNDGLLDNAGSVKEKGFIKSNDYGGARFNKMVVKDEQIEQIISNMTDAYNKELKISIKCVNPIKYLKLDDIGKEYVKNRVILTWAQNAKLKKDGIIHSSWKDGCHKDVGEIIVTNADGATNKITNFITPSLKDEEKTFTVKDPCKLTKLITPAPAITKTK